MPSSLTKLRQGLTGWSRGKSSADAQQQASDQSTEPEAFGLTTLAEGTDIVVDIVAVHGLNGHREKTWTAKNNVLWLRDLLPYQIPNARIFSWGYDANTHGVSAISTQLVYDHAKTLISDLCLKRRLTSTQRRPIIFVCHSLGGLVVKSALIHSDSARAHHLEHHRSIKLSTFGIFFLGTPHQGGEGVEWGQRLLRVASIFMHTNHDVLDDLSRNSSWLLQQLGQYAPISRDFITKFAYETYPTPLPIGPALLVVPQSSAVVPGAVDAEPIAILANHPDMVKYPAANDNGYEKVAGHLQLMIPEAAAKVVDNWEREEMFLRSIMSTSNLSLHKLTYKPLARSVVPNEAGHKEVGLKPIDHTSCIEWLSFPDYNAREKLITEACPGTFTWVLGIETFTEWVKSGEGVFLIRGKPGSGKSTLMKYLLRSTRDEVSHSLYHVFPVVVAIFFNALGSALEKTLGGFLRSSIIQILQQNGDLFLNIAEEYLKAYAERDLSESTLIHMLKTLVRQCTSTTKVCFFIDAIDECDGSVREQILFLEELIGISRDSKIPLHVCISGRPLPALAWLNGYPELTLEDHTLVDISTYVSAKCNRLNSASDIQVYGEFQQDIIEKAKGIFLWVVLVIEELLSGWETSSTIAELRRRLSDIPDHLDEFFGRMLRKIPGAHVAETLAMIQCVIGAARPLTLPELRCALAFGSERSFRSLSQMASSEDIVHSDDGMIRRIQNCGGGLLEVSKPSLRVQFIHQTAIDFLLKPGRLKDLGSDRCYILPPRSNQYLLRASIKYLSMQELKEIPFVFSSIYWEAPATPGLERFHFLAYSLANWVDHYVEAEKEGESQFGQIKDFADAGNRHFFTWYRLYCQVYAGGWDGEDPPFTSFAAEHKLTGYLKDRISQGHVEDTDGGEFGGPLQAAVVSGDLETVSLLINSGVDINARGGRFGTAMAAAITFKNSEAISLLGRHGATVELSTPGSPILGGGAWQYHRNPFSRLRALQQENTSYAFDKSIVNESDATCSPQSSNVLAWPAPNDDGYEHLASEF